MGKYVVERGRTELRNVRLLFSLHLCFLQSCCYNAPGPSSNYTYNHIAPIARKLVSPTKLPSVFVAPIKSLPPVLTSKCKDSREPGAPPFDFSRCHPHLGHLSGLLQQGLAWTFLTEAFVGVEAQPVKESP